MIRRCERLLSHKKLPFLQYDEDLIAKMDPGSSQKFCLKLLQCSCNPDVDSSRWLKLIYLKRWAWPPQTFVSVLEKVPLLSSVTSADWRAFSSTCRNELVKCSLAQLPAALYCPTADKLLRHTPLMSFISLQPRLAGTYFLAAIGR